MKKAVAGIVLLMASGCAGPPGPSPIPPIGPEPVPSSDPSPTPRMWTCDSACDNQRKLGCELGKPTAEGSSCEEVCQNSQESPLVGLHWDVETLSNETHCE